jgi:DNA-binding NtrC family response regulator
MVAPEEDYMRIAIVEDDISMRKSLEVALGEYDEFEIESFKNPVDALGKISDTTHPRYDLIITDITMPKMNGIDFIKELGGSHEIIVITGNATLNFAIESIRLGVKDFLLKPFEIDTLVAAIKRSQKVVAKKVSASDQTKRSDDDMFYATSPALERALAMTKKAAKTDATIMLLGESGVGKELFAKYIHKNSPRSAKPYVALNMAAIPEHLLESELFGYEKGAFTDAISDKKGLFETANGGTLFLDEIAEMPLALQAKILRVLQEREVIRVGGVKPKKIDVHVVSATNKNLNDLIVNKTFREDLYFRLNTIPIEIPPLRERQEETLGIAQAVLSDVCEKYNFAPKHFDDQAKSALLSYAWPGNIRELIGVVERAAILSEGDVIENDDLFLESRTSEKKSIKSMERELIDEVLKELDHDLTQAASILGMTEKSLEKKIDKYNLKGEN